MYVNLEVIRSFTLRSRWSRTSGVGIDDVKGRLTRQTYVGRLVLAKFKLVCVNETTTCWQTVGEK